MCTSLEEPSGDQEFVCEELRSLRSGMDAVAMALEKGNVRNYSEEQLYNEITKVNSYSLSRPVTIVFGLLNFVGWL